MTNKDAKTDFNNMLVTGLICAVVGALIAGLLSYWLMNKGRVDQAQDAKLNALSEELLNVAAATKAANNHNDGEPEVNTFKSVAGKFCEDYKVLDTDADWSSYPALRKPFQTQFKGLYYMICHPVDFYTAAGSKTIPANAYQFVNPEFVRDVAKEVEAATLVH